MGYILECDLEYATELHDANNDYPIAAERLDIQLELLSETQVAISRHYARTRAAKNFKLVPNLMSNLMWFNIGTSSSIWTTACDSPRSTG